MGTVAITDSTLWGNASTQGGAIDNPTISAAVRIGGSIIGGSGSGGNCDVPQIGPFIDGGYNLTDRGGDCGLNGPTDLTNTDPGLDPGGLRDNGSPTPTIALLSTSPAIAAGSCSLQAASGTTITTDQRGQPRPADGAVGCDIGAYQSSAAAQTVDTTDGAPPTATPELGSGELLATGLVPLAATLLYRRRARALRRHQP